MANIYHNYEHIICPASDSTHLVCIKDHRLSAPCYDRVRWCYELQGIAKEMEDMEAEAKPAETKPEQKVESEVKPENTKIETGKNSDLVNEFEAYIKGLAEHGEDYVPEFMDKASPLFKEYFNYNKERNNNIGNAGIKIKKTKTSNKIHTLMDIENFIKNKSTVATREDYIKITDEIAKLMPEYIKTKYPKVRPEIAENADIIYKWKIAMSGQKQPGTPDANGKYPITTDKFFDAEAHDKAVKEFTAFLEEMTGKKVLVGNSVRFDEFVNMLGCFNNSDFYKDVDYIVLGHGTGSSLVTDNSDPNAWVFKGNSESVWDYISDNIPKGKKALLLVCEHDGKTAAERKNMPEMYDDNGVYMDGIGDVTSGMSGAHAKIVISGVNHIVGTVECKVTYSARELIGGGIGGDVTTKYYSIDSKVKNNKANETGIKEETKSTVEVKPDESASAGNRTNDKISPELMAEFEHYASENNLKLTISKHGNVVFRDNDGKIARGVDIDENGNIRDDKVFTESTTVPKVEITSDKGLKTDNDFIQYLAVNHVSYDWVEQNGKFIIRISDNTKLFNKNRFYYYVFEDGKLIEKRLDCTKKEMGKLDWTYRSGKSRTLNLGVDPNKINESKKAHDAAQSLRDVGTEATPEKRSRTGKRTNEKIPPILMAEFENYAKEILEIHRKQYKS